MEEEKVETKAQEKIDSGKRKNENECMKSQIEITEEMLRKPLFLKENWSKLLCHCQTCSQEYKKAKIDDIINFDDNVD